MILKIRVSHRQQRDSWDKSRFSSSLVSGQHEIRSSVYHLRRIRISTAKSTQSRPLGSHRNLSKATTCVRAGSRSRSTPSRSLARNATSSQKRRNYKRMTKRHTAIRSRSQTLRSNRALTRRIWIIISTMGSILSRSRLRCWAKKHTCTSRNFIVKYSKTSRSNWTNGIIALTATQTRSIQFLRKLRESPRLSWWTNPLISSFWKCCLTSALKRAKLMRFFIEPTIRLNRTALIAIAMGTAWFASEKVSKWSSITTRSPDASASSSSSQLTGRACPTSLSNQTT